MAWHVWYGTAMHVKLNLRWSSLRRSFKCESLCRAVSVLQLRLAYGATEARDGELLIGLAVERRRDELPPRRPTRFACCFSGGVGARARQNEREEKCMSAPSPPTLPSDRTGRHTPLSFPDC